MFDPETILAFPVQPGVYIMKNAAGDIIYVGKAANLRNRVRNYFTRTGDSRFTIQFIVKNVHSIETVVTASEKDAFLLENTLIKKHRPRYNIQLRDDKTYISLRLRMNHDYPRLESVRVRRFSAGSSEVGSGKLLAAAAEAQEAEKASRKRKPRDPDLYFGPYTSSSSVRETIRFLLRVFPIRTCRDSVFRNRTRPCILFDVGKCCGPCTEPVPTETYAQLVQNVASFLRGKRDEVRQTLHARMMELSNNMQFESAALVRDRLQALDRTLERPDAATHELSDRDIIAVASSQGRSLVITQQFREGSLMHTQEYYLKNYEQEDREVLYSFLSQHYDGLMGAIPAEILVNIEPCDCELLEEWLREQRHAGVVLHVPQRGKLAGLVHTTTQNARISLNRHLSGERTEAEVLGELTEKLGLEKEPRIIECVDISNIMGVLAVGSLVRFEDAKPDKSGYRLFRIRSVEGSNDFAMMREVLSRRFRPDPERKNDFPDLLIVDGGKGQLGIAEEVMRELGITTVQLAAIAKSRLKVREVPQRIPRKPIAQVEQQPASAVEPATSLDAKALNTFFPDAPNYVGEDVPAPEVQVRRGNRARAFQIKSDEAIFPPAPAPAASKEVIRFRTEERIFLPGRKNPVTFATNSPALYLLERIRDETHRTAITYHRKLRQKANRISVLDEVPGVGPKRKKLLLRHFGSLTALRTASVDQLTEVNGMSAAAAESVYQFLHASHDPEKPEIMEVDNDELPEGAELAVEGEVIETEDS